MRRDGPREYLQLVRSLAPLLVVVGFWICLLGIISFAFAPDVMPRRQIGLAVMLAAPALRPTPWFMALGGILFLLARRGPWWLAGLL